MPSIPALQCLFCKHFNPAAAIFCNACGTQLNLKPCKQCGAIDKRAAEKCNECDTPFDMQIPLASKADATAIHGNAFSSSVLTEDGVTGNLPTQPVPDLTAMPTGVQENAESSLSDPDLSPSRSRRRWSIVIAVLVMVLAVDMVAVYFYYSEPEQLAQSGTAKTDAVSLVVQEASVEVKNDSLTPPSRVMPINVGSSPQINAPQHAPGALVVLKAPSAATSQGVATLTGSPLTSSTTSKDSRSNTSNMKECSSSVATLGLCDAVSNE